MNVNNTASSKRKQAIELVSLIFEPPGGLVFKIDGQVEFLSFDDFSLSHPLSSQLTRKQLAQICWHKGFLAACEENRDR